jgi:hypothetical protein
MVVTATTSKNSYEFLLAGAACFPAGFSSRPPMDMRSFDDRYKEVIQGAVTEVYRNYGAK